MSRLALVLVLLVACKDNNREPGEKCRYNHQCASGICGPSGCETGETGTKCSGDSNCRANKGFHCFGGFCRELGHQNDQCNFDSDCGSALKCGDSSCLPPDQARIAEEKVTARNVAARKKQEAETEARLLAESGVVAEGSAVERAANPPGPGSRVRVVTTTAKGKAFAACRTDERLIGGGCRATSNNGSYPSAHGDEDTIGARWNCETGGSVDVSAYALCSKLP